MSELDSKRQRNALTAAERSLQALGAGNGERAVRSAAKAMDLDQLDRFEGLPNAIAAAAGDIHETGDVTTSAWDRLEGLVGPGPLHFLIQELRS